MTSALVSEYVYVDTAIGGVNRRNRVRRLSEVDYSPGSERYISHRRATESLVDWVGEHQTVAGFDGATWDSSLPFDFDDRTDPAHALEWTRQFVDKLAREDVPLDALRFYFSGAKGFHLEIPHTLFGGFEPSDTLHASEKLAAVELMGGIPFDSAVYDKLRLWRLPNTINAKSGMYKVRLSLEEMRGCSMADILGLASGPRPRMVTVPDEEWMPNLYLMDVWSRALGLEQSTNGRQTTAEQPTWSDSRQGEVLAAMVVAAIANSWPSDPRFSRHSDYLLPLSGFLGRYMNADDVAGLLKAAVLQANDRGFIEDRTRHWESEIERMAQSSVTKIAAGEKAEGLPTIARHWPELADMLGALFVVQVKTERAQSTGKASGFTFTLLEDLLAEPPEDTAFLVEGMLPSAGISLWGAKPKSGKSVAVRNLALAVSRGESFLDRACSRGAVLVLCLEEKRAEVANHFRDMGGRNELLHVHTGAAPQTSKEGIAALENAIATFQPVLVIIDPALKLVRVKDSSDYAELTRELEPVIELARNTGCHIAVTHHLGKQQREGGDDVLGSTAIFGAVDTLVLIRRRKDNIRTLQTIQRYGADISETVVPMDETTGRISLGSNVSELKKVEAREAVLEVLGKLGKDEEGLSKKEVRLAAGVASELSEKATSELFAEGLLERSGKGVGGDPYRYRMSSFPPFSTSSEKEERRKGGHAEPSGEASEKEPKEPKEPKEAKGESILDRRPVMCRVCGKELWPDEEAAGVHEECERGAS